jgi:hypothetical protein
MTSYKKKFIKLYGLADNVTISLNDISTISSIPVEALQVIYNRGLQKDTISQVQFSFHKQRKVTELTQQKKEQNAYNRVYAFVMKDKKVFNGSDDDIRIAYNLE